MAYLLQHTLYTYKTLPDKYGTNDVARPKNLSREAEMFTGRVATEHAINRTFSTRTGKYLHEHDYGVFYNRFIVEKTLYNFGVLTGDKSEKFAVFNGYGVHHTITSVTFDNLAGVEVVADDGSFPIKLPPYRSVYLRIVISTQNSTALNGSFTLHFSNGETLTINTKGSRSILWNIRPNWDNGVVEQFEYKTDIITSFNKKEQRRGFLMQPRRRVAYTAIPSRDTLRSLRNMLHGWQDKSFIMPLWWQAAFLDKNVEVDTKQLHLRNYEHFDFADGMTIVIWGNENYNDVLEVQDFSNGIVNISTSTTAFFPSGTVVFPAVTVCMPNEMILQALTSTIGSLEVEANYVQQNSKLTMPESNDILHYKGIEVLDKTPNWAEDITETYMATYDELDFGYGIREQISRGVPSLVQKEMSFVAKTYEEIKWWKAFIHRQKGALKSFLVPTYTFDAVLLADTPINTDILYFKDEFLADIVRNSPERQYIKMKYNEKVYYFTILDVKNDNGITSVKIDEAVSETIFTNDVLSISYLQRMRFASDNIGIEYRNSSVAEISVTLQQIREVK